MKHLIIIATLLVSAALSAQANYEKGMSKAFSLWEQNNWAEAEQLFERIAAAEPNEWLPNYYIAQMNSLKSWEEKDPDILKAQLDKAQEYLNTALALAPNNPDVMVMQANVYTNRVSFDGMKEGRNYLLDSTLEQIETDLEPQKFFGVSRKFFVNIEAIIDIISYTNSRLQIKLHAFKEHDIIVARERVKEFKDWLE